MRKFKIIFYIVTLIYIVVSTVICLSACYPYAEWSSRLRISLNMGIWEMVDLIALGNMINAGFLLALWSIENTHIWQLKHKHKKLERHITALKAELYDKEQVHTARNQADQATTSHSSAAESSQIKDMNAAAHPNPPPLSHSSDSESSGSV